MIQQYVEFLQVNVFKFKDEQKLFIQMFLNILLNDNRKD